MKEETEATTTELTVADKMRMLLAEAGFVQGRDYHSIVDDADGYWIRYPGQYTDALGTSIDRAWTLVSAAAVAAGSEQ